MDEAKTVKTFSNQFATNFNSLRFHLLAPGQSPQ